MLEIRLIAVGVILATAGALYWQWNNMKSQIAYFEQETARLEASLENYKGSIEEARKDIDSLKLSRDRIDEANRQASEQIVKIRRQLNVQISQEAAQRNPSEVQRNMSLIISNALDCLEILSGRTPVDGEKPCD